MGHAIVRNEPSHGMRLKGHEVMRKIIFALSVERVHYPSMKTRTTIRLRAFGLINRTFNTVLILLSNP